MRVNPLTVLASVVWSTSNAGVRWASRAGLLRSRSLGVRVLSVGNLQAGGSGKTPLVARIATEAAQRGLNVCILCRGYGGEWESRGGVIRPSESAPGEGTVDPGKCGDEAALLHELAPKAWIGVGADRVRQFRWVQAEAAKERPAKRVDLVILDDGFQNWKIRKDVEIVALTSTGWLRRLHRDWPGAVRRAQLLVWTKGQEGPPRTEGVPLVRARMSPVPSRDFSDRLKKPLLLVTGVGDPRAVHESLKAVGYEIQRHLIFPDHARYAAEMVQGILKSAVESGCRVALTGKDWVKWRALGVQESEVMVFEPRLEFLEGGENWERVLWPS